MKALQEPAFMAVAIARPPTSDIDMTAVRVHNSRIDSKKKNRKKYFRRELVTIRNLETGAFIVRAVMGTPNGFVYKFARDMVMLDYDSRDALMVENEGKVQLLVKRATFFDVCRYFWAHPDAEAKLATRIAVVSFALAVVSLAVTVVPML